MRMWFDDASLQAGIYGAYIHMRSRVPGLIHTHILAYLHMMNVTTQKHAPGPRIRFTPIDVDRPLEEQVRPCMCIVYWGTEGHTHTYMYIYVQHHHHTARPSPPARPPPLPSFLPSRQGPFDAILHKLSEDVVRRAWDPGKGVRTWRLSLSPASTAHTPSPSVLA